ncbi:MAG TPA: tetratricopeptide repeat protein [Gemmataceae bacterium]|nr:tetratricopeptide repeat protein [Gemmataceae bacterium]
MIGFLSERLRPSRQYALVGTVILVLLAGIGLGATAIGRYVWAEHCFGAAERALERKDFAAAGDYLTRCLAARPESADAHFLAARTARRALNYEEAERQLREYQKRDGAAELLQLERALAAAQHGNLDHVEAPLLALVQQDHADAVLILEALSRGYLRSLRLEDADTSLRLWLERRPDDVQALLWRGEVQERMLHKEEALAAYRRAVELSPEQDDARLHFAELLLRARQPKEAARHLDVLRQRQPENTAVLLDLARCRRLQGEAEEARRLLDGALAADPENAGLLGERGLLDLESGRAKEAEPLLRKAVALAPYDRETVYTLSRCLQLCGKAAEAEACVKKLEEIDAQLARLDVILGKMSAAPHDAGLRHEAGMIFLQSGQAKEGLRWLHSALQIDPLHPPTHRALADYFDKLGDHSQASWHRHLAAPSTGAMGN